MRNRRRRISTGNDKTLSSQILGLALFIMMLAFFIVLNSISSFEEARIRPVLASVGNTFASKQLESENVMPSVTESDDESSREGDTLEQMKALFNAHIPGQKSAVNKTRGELFIQVPFDAFEAAVTAIGRENGQSGDRQAPDRGPAAKSSFLLPTLVALIKGSEAGMPYRMDMLLGVSVNPALMKNDEPQQFSALMKKMAGIAQRLESAGMPRKLLSAGIQKGDNGMVDIMFRPHIPFNPLGEDGAHEQRQ